MKPAPPLLPLLRTTPPPMVQRTAPQVPLILTSSLLASYSSASLGSANVLPHIGAVNTTPAGIVTASIATLANANLPKSGTPLATLSPIDETPPATPPLLQHLATAALTERKALIASTPSLPQSYQRKSLTARSTPPTSQRRRSLTASPPPSLTASTSSHHRKSLTATTPPPPPSQRNSLTSSTSAPPCHRKSLIATTAPTPSHRKSLTTSALLLSPSQRKSLTVSTPKPRTRAPLLRSSSARTMPRAPSNQRRKKKYNFSKSRDYTNNQQFADIERAATAEGLLGDISITDRARGAFSRGYSGVRASLTSPSSQIGKTPPDTPSRRIRNKQHTTSPVTQPIDDRYHFTESDDSLLHHRLPTAAGEQQEAPPHPPLLVHLNVFLLTHCEFAHSTYELHGELTTGGQRAAQELYSKMGGWPIDEVYCSPLVQSRQSVVPLCQNYKTSAPRHYRVEWALMPQMKSRVETHFLKEIPIRQVPIHFEYLKQDEDAHYACSVPREDLQDCESAVQFRQRLFRFADALFQHQVQVAHFEQDATHYQHHHNQRSHCGNHDKINQLSTHRRIIYTRNVLVCADPNTLSALTGIFNAYPQQPSDDSHRPSEAIPSAYTEPGKVHLCFCDAFMTL